MIESNDTSTHHAHEEVSDLLPWYANGTLGLDEKNRVEAHLNSCNECANQLRQFEDMDLILSRSNTQSWEPSEAHFEKLMALIDENTAASEIPAMPKKQSQHFMSAWRSWFDAIPNGIRWTLALETFAVAGFAAALLLPRVAPIPSETVLFQTYSREKTQTTPLKGHRINVVFSPATSVSEVGLIAKSIQAQIVGGPTSLGVYILEIPDSQPEENAVSQLRSNKNIILAEPVPDN
jgi:anti-sigma factor RsiW